MNCVISQLLTEAVVLGICLGGSVDTGLVVLIDCRNCAFYSSEQLQCLYHLVMDITKMG